MLTQGTPFLAPLTGGARWAPEVHAGGVWGAKIDLCDCYWSVRLPPAMAGVVKVVDHAGGLLRGGASGYQEGFLVSSKSALDATQCLSWMGKNLGRHRARMAHKPEG